MMNYEVFYIMPTAFCSVFSLFSTEISSLWDEEISIPLGIKYW
ncbi:MAG: hypothetical protein WC209_08205 [Ignavibacteriaceae bacterium]